MLPPGRGSKRMGKRGVSDGCEWEACCTIVGSGWVYLRAAGAQSIKEVA